MPGYREVRGNPFIGFCAPSRRLCYGEKMNTTKFGKLSQDHPEIDGFSLAEYLDLNYPQICVVCGKCFTPGKWIVLMSRITYHIECFTNRAEVYYERKSSLLD